MNTAETRKPFLISTSLVSLGLRSERSMGRHERLWLLLVLAIFALFAAYHACTVPLWFDELFTLFISRLTSLPEMLRAMPADCQPPLQYLLTHFSLQVFGVSELSLRLPEVLAFMAAGLLTYKIVHRHGTAVQAHFALTLLLGSQIGIEQAYTARPYGLLIAFTALTFACWQEAALREHHRLLPLCGVALGVAGAILSQHFGVVHVGLLLAAGETTRLIQRRRLDGWMIAAISAGMSPLAITLPLANQSHQIFGIAILQSTNYRDRPSLTNLIGYLHLIALPLVFLVVAFAFLPWRRDKNGDRADLLPSVPTHEWMAAWALSLLLPIQMLVASFEHRDVASRYAIGTSLGLVLLGAWGLPRLSRLRFIAQSLLALSTQCFLLLIAATLLIENLRQPIWNAQPGQEAVSSVLLNVPGKLPIVVDNYFEYPQEWWYTQSAVKRRLVHLSDVQFVVKRSDFVGELSLVADQAYLPLPISDYAAFISSNPHFFLFCSGEPNINWTNLRLTSAGWHLTPIAGSGGDVLYEVDRP